MSPEQKKHLLYAGGALASIAALVLFMKNKQAPGNMPISSAGMGSGISGAGGVSSGTSANNAAALNAAVGLAVAQSQQANALAVAQLQSQTALQIAGLQSQTLKDQANAKTAQAALGPGGAVTAAAPAAAKGVFDLLGKGFDALQKAFSPTANPPGQQPNFGNTGVNDFTGYSLYPGSNTPGYYVLAPVPGEESTYNMPDFTQYVPPASYGDYYQGSIGGGDSGWSGSSPTDFINPDQFDPGSQPEVSPGVE
jgi:hypothetical protein